VAGQLTEECMEGVAGVSTRSNLGNGPTTPDRDRDRLPILRCGSGRLEQS